MDNQAFAYFKLN